MIINIETDINKIDFLYLSIFVLFVFQLKISSVIIFTLYFLLLFKVLVNKIYSFTDLFVIHSLVLFFGIIWLLKSYLTTGCFIFPVSITCINSFDWYIHETTLEIQEYTAGTSFAFLEYFQNDDKTFIDWFNNFFFNSEASGFSNFYKSIYFF